MLCGCNWNRCNLHTSCRVGTPSRVEIGLRRSPIPNTSHEIRGKLPGPTAGNQIRNRTPCWGKLRGLGEMGEYWGEVVTYVWATVRS